MACNDDGNAAVIPLPVWIVCRTVNEPPRLVMYYGGSLRGWSSNYQASHFYLRRSDAEQVRDALGVGVVLRLYDRPGGILPGRRGKP